MLLKRIDKVTKLWFEVVKLENLLITASSFRPKLTLNLEELDMRQRPALGLSLMGLTMNLNNIDTLTGSEVIDINVPLEKQG